MDATAPEGNLDGLSEYLDAPAGTVDVAAFLNAHFSDSASLSSGVGGVEARLCKAIAGIDEDLSSKLRAHRHAGEESGARVGAARASVALLEERLGALGAAAATAEESAMEAAGMWGRYEVALRNTRRTGEALEALVALADGVDRLEEGRGDVVEAFGEVEKALKVLEGEERGGLGRLGELRDRAGVAKEGLRQNVLAEFRVLSDTVTLATRGETVAPKVEAAVERLRTACVVAGAIGKEVRDEVVGEYIRKRLLAFRAAFEMDQTGMIGIDRRFGWVRRELRSNWASLGGEVKDKGWGTIFPAEWDVAWRFSSAAMRDLRTWVCSTLDAGADRDVVAMVGALGKAKEFENELDRRFARAEQPSSTSEKVSGESGKRPPFFGALSGCFGPYMSSYVQQEDEHLRVTFLDLVRGESWKCSDGGVLKSSTDLFLAVKKSMRMCAALDSRQSLFSLYKVFRKHLGAYVTELERHIPAPVKFSPPSLGPLSSAADAAAAAKASAKTMDSPEFQKKIESACAIIGTAEYCATTVEQLEESLRDILEDAYAAGVTMEAERDRFSATTAKGVSALVALVCGDLDGSLNSLVTSDWSEWSVVGDTSPYVEEISGKLTLLMPVLGNKLSKAHMRFYLERFAAEVVALFSRCIYSCGTMNHTAAQQLLLDATAIKGHILSVPTIAGSSIPGTYHKNVNREMAKVDAMLKVVLSPIDMCVSAYNALIPGGSAADLRRILEIKGLLRAESAPLLLEYTRLAGPQHGLESPEDLSKERSPTIRAPSTENGSVKDSMVSRGSALMSSPFGSGGGLSGAAGASTTASASAEAGVESVRALFRGFGTSWGSQLKDANIADRLGQTAGRMSESFETTTELMKKRFGTGGGGGAS